MHNKSVFQAAKQLKRKMKPFRSVKYCLWDVNMLSVIASIIFSTFINKCLYPYMGGFDSVLKFREDDILVTLLKYNFHTFVSRQIRKLVLQVVLGNMNSEIFKKILENLT